MLGSRLRTMATAARDGTGHRTATLVTTTSCTTMVAATAHPALDARSQSGAKLNAETTTAATKRRSSDRLRGASKSRDAARLPTTF